MSRVMPARAGLAGDHMAAGNPGRLPGAACGRNGGARYPRRSGWF